MDQLHPLPGTPHLPDAGTPLRDWADFALDLAGRADAISMAHFRRDLHIETKPDRSFVTEADRAIEQMARNRILAAYPDHGIVGEEYGEERAGAELRWYVDPIDGTHNYMRGVPVFATLIALESRSGLELGVVSAPALGTRWFAWRDGGAWSIDLPGGPAGGGDLPRRLAVSGIARIEEAQLLYSSPREVVRSGLAPGWERALGRAWRERGFGDFWGYMLVAEGAAEAMVEVGIHSWDLAAVRVVVEEAGGRLTDLRGSPTIHNPSSLATNGVLHETILEAFRTTDRPATGT